jgi:integrase
MMAADEKRGQLVGGAFRRFPHSAQYLSSAASTARFACSILSAINMGRIFRKVNKTGHIWGDSMTEKAVWHVVKECAKRIGVAKLVPHDLRRTCAKLCQASGGELEQIQFLLGHVSVQTTERYLGCKQRIRSAVNDRIGIEPRP